MSEWKVTGAEFMRNPAVLWRRCLDGTMLVLRPGLHPLFLPPPGDLIWDLFEQPRTADHVIDDLLDIFAADRQQVGHDVQAFIEQLHLVGAIEFR